MVGVSSFNGGRSLRCPKERVFFELGLTKKTEQEIE